MLTSSCVYSASCSTWASPRSSRNTPAVRSAESRPAAARSRAAHDPAPEARREARIDIVEEVLPARVAGLEHGRSHAPVLGRIETAARVEHDAIQRFEQAM